MWWGVISVVVMGLGPGGILGGEEDHVSGCGPVAISSTLSI